MDNPLQTDGFEFVEYTAPNRAGIEQLHQLFGLLGFSAVARHRSKDVTLFRQGDINFLVNGTPTPTSPSSPPPTAPAPAPWAGA